MSEPNTIPATPKEIAARYRVSPATVRRWISEGRLRAFRVGPRALRIWPEDAAVAIQQAGR